MAENYVTLNHLKKTADSLLIKINEDGETYVSKDEILPYVEEGTPIANVGNTTLYIPQNLTTRQDVEDIIDDSLSYFLNEEFPTPDWEEEDDNSNRIILNKPSIRAGSGTDSIIEGEMPTEELIGTTIYLTGGVDTETYSFTPSLQSAGTYMIVRRSNSLYYPVQSVDIANQTISFYESLGAMSSSAVTLYTNGLSKELAGNASHSEGGGTSVAIGNDSHAEGRHSVAVGSRAHSEGYWSIAKGAISHAEGFDTYARGGYSHAEGLHTVAYASNQHVQGKYNLVDSASVYADIVGNGSSKESRSNAYTLDWDGNGWYAGKVSAGTTAAPASVVNNNDLTTKAYVDNAISSISNVKVVTFTPNATIKAQAGRDAYVCDTAPSTIESWINNGFPVLGIIIASDGVTKSQVCYCVRQQCFFKMSTSGQSTTAGTATALYNRFLLLATTYGSNVYLAQDEYLDERSSLSISGNRITLTTTNGAGDSTTSYVDIPESFEVSIVNELPSSNIDTHTIYFISNSESSPNAYDEYMYINNNWEKIGDTNIDLSNYVYKEHIHPDTGAKQVILNEQDYNFGLAARRNQSGAIYDYSHIYLSGADDSAGSVEIEAQDYTNSNSSTIILNADHIQAGTGWTPTWDSDFTTKAYVDNSIPDVSGFITDVQDHNGISLVSNGTAKLPEYMNIQTIYVLESNTSQNPDTVYLYKDRVCNEPLTYIEIETTYPFILVGFYDGEDVAYHLYAQKFLNWHLYWNQVDGYSSFYADLYRKISVGQETWYSNADLGYSANGNAIDYNDLINKPTIPTSPTITLNGSTTSTPSFYAPTTGGTFNWILRSNGNSAPSWTPEETGIVVVNLTFDDGEIYSDKSWGNISGAIDLNKFVYAIDSHFGTVFNLLEYSSYGDYQHITFANTGYDTVTGEMYVRHVIMLGDGTWRETDYTLISPNASTVAPLADGVAAVGVSAAYARADHVHPKISYSLSLSNGTLTLTGSDGSTSNVNLPIYDGTVVSGGGS